MLAANVRGARFVPLSAFGGSLWYFWDCGSFWRLPKGKLLPKIAANDFERTFYGIFPHMNVEESYRLLGLKAGATLEEVKQSYRILARKYHPDANPGDSRSHDKFI